MGVVTPESFLWVLDSLQKRSFVGHEKRVKSSHKTPIHKTFPFSFLSLFLKSININRQRQRNKRNGGDGNAVDRTISFPKVFIISFFLIYQYSMRKMAFYFSHS